eukprot:261672-Amphidinium_carterae.1
MQPLAQLKDNDHKERWMESNNQKMSMILLCYVSTSNVASYVMASECKSVVAQVPSDCLQMTMEAK